MIIMVSRCCSRIQQNPKAIYAGLCVMLDNAELRNEKGAISCGFRWNRPINSALFNTRQNSRYAELGITAISTPDHCDQVPPAEPKLSDPARSTRQLQLQSRGRVGCSDY